MTYVNLKKQLNIREYCKYNNSIKCGHKDSLCNTCEIYAVYLQARKDLITELKSDMGKVWESYEKDKKNVPKPDFISVYTLLALKDDSL